MQTAQAITHLLQRLHHSKLSVFLAIMVAIGGYILIQVLIPELRAELFTPLVFLCLFGCFYCCCKPDEPDQENEEPKD